MGKLPFLLVENETIFFGDTCILKGKSKRELPRFQRPMWEFGDTLPFSKRKLPGKQSVPFLKATGLLVLRVKLMEININMNSGY